MKRMKQLLVLTLIFCLFLTGCNKTGTGSDNKSTGSTKSITLGSEALSFDEFMLEIFKDYAASDALTLHYTLKDPAAYGITLEEVTLGSFDFSDLEEMKKEDEDFLTYIKRYYNDDSLTDEQKLTLDIVSAYLEDSMGYYDYLYFQAYLNPTTGIQTQLPVLMSEYTFYDTEDVDNYLLLLHDVYNYYESILEFERTKSSEGLFMADFTAQAIIEQCQTFIKDPETNLLLEIFEDKLSDELPDLSSEERADYIKKNEEAVAKSVIPAYELLIEGLTELMGTGTNDGGLGNFDNGKEYYKMLVRQKTGSDKSPEELIKLTEKVMDEALMTISLCVQSDPSILSEVDYPSYIYTDPTEAIDYLKESIAESFPEPADVTYNVKYVHKSLEEDISPAFYLTPPIDDIYNNVIYINGNSRYDQEQLFPTLAHEGYPGHLYQISYFLSTEPAEIRSVFGFNGYSEGWATYVEGLSYRWAGLNETLADFLQAYLNYSQGLYSRIDLGIHYECWTQDDVHSYLSDYGITDKNVAKEIFETLIAMPASYLSYGIGSFEFQALREKAEQELDDAFNEKEFHKFLLDIGPCQFDIIGKYMDQWLLTQ